MTGGVIERRLRVLGLAGSLRRGSLNRGLLRAAVELAPPGMAVESFDLREIPLYDEDLRLAGAPSAVAQLKRKVADANAVLICTPEYNHSFSPITKNAIDWISRPPAESPLDGKPVGIMGASDGHFGTARAQAALRIVLAATRSAVMPAPAVLVFDAKEHADEEGNIVDPEVRDRISRYMAALAEWTHRLGAPGHPDDEPA